MVKKFSFFPKWEWSRYFMYAAATKSIIRVLDRAAVLLGRAPARAAHLATGTRGEEDTYFHLRNLGYVIVARNFRSAKRKGEVDLIGWDSNTLCFIEVKTRSKRAFIPAEAAVDGNKQNELRAMAHEYKHRVKGDPPHRFDVVSVYYDSANGAPQFELIKDAFSIK
jgi:putative endonuclease